MLPRRRAEVLLEWLDDFNQTADAARDDGLLSSVERAEYRAAAAGQMEAIQEFRSSMIGEVAKRRNQRRLQELENPSEES